MEQHLTYSEQLNLFKERGIAGIDLESNKFKKQVNTIKIIGYYKLKQYAYVFWNEDLNKYEGISFDNLVKRYYRDQRLKQEIFQAIGDIETALNNEISYVLGKRDPYLYLDFEKWCQHNGRNSYLRARMDKYKVKTEELSFLSQLQYKLKKSNYLDIQAFERDHSTKVFPTIWLTVNAITFGESIYLVKLMTPDRRMQVSKELFHLKPNRLIRNLELLNLIRNICCHNGNLAGLSLKTMPKIPNKYRKYLNMRNGNYPHRLAVVIIALMDLMYPLNKKYKFKDLQKTLNLLCEAPEQDSSYLARKMGFKDKSSINLLINSFKNNRTTTYYPDGNYIYID